MGNVLRCDIAVSKETLDACRAIRTTVFVDGQGVPATRLDDGLDDTATHLLMTLDGAPIGTARILIEGERALIERVAVLDAYQGLGYGKELMRAAIERAWAVPQINHVMLGAQLPRVPFYASLGFRPVGDVYDDTGRPHQKMEMFRQ